MREELFTSFGFYSPTFFKMHVHTTESLIDLNSLSEACEATYYHEYIHFIQDISSTNGLININSVVDYLRYSNHEIISKQGDSFKVPIVPIPSDSNNVYANLKLRKVYLGGGDPVADIKQINFVETKSELLKTNSGDKEVIKVVLKCESVSGNLMDYHFGAYCISESMAYAMENIAYPNVLGTPPVMPYKSVELLLAYTYPELERSDINVVAICDASLMYFQPGLILYSALIKMRERKFIPDKPEDIIDFVYQNFTFNYHGYTTVNQLLLGTGAEGITQLTGYFTTPLFQENRQWINYILCSAMDIRIEIPYFILDIARGGRMKSNPYFLAFIKKIGSPVVLNDNYEMSMASPETYNFNIVPEYLWVINQIYKIFLGKTNAGTIKCEMIRWCDDSADQSGVPIFTDHRCRYDPWTRASDADPHHCPFGKLWKTWALTTKHPAT